ncbi:hypothetical protein D3C77_617450 [compost metagenome]
MRFADASGNLFVFTTSRHPKATIGRDAARWVRMCPPDSTSRQPIRRPKGRILDAECDVYRMIGAS